MNEQSREQQLVSAARDGDMDAFEALVHLYEKRVFALTLRMCGNPEDAAEAAQEAFLAAWQGLAFFRGEASFSTWLYRLVSNACVDLLRRDGRRRASAGPSLDDEELNLDVPDPAPSPQDAAERQELREEIDKMNLWLFDNINNAIYRSSFSRSNEGHFDGVNTFYAAMDRLEKRLETNRFLFGDYVTDSDIRLYVTLARLDIRYTAQLGETKHPLYTYKNLWGYAKELWEIPAFKNNTFFADFAVPPADAKGSVERSFNVRFLKQLDFAQFWGNVDDRSALSSDPEHKLKAENDAGTARRDRKSVV